MSFQENMRSTAGHDGQDIIRPLTEDRLRFLCHRKIACFNACCADLCLVLTPYDILRIKRHLGLTSSTFLEDYTEPHEGHPAFPLIRLKMGDDKIHSCPFVTDAGCSVYEDRPVSCRLYPLGRAATGGPREGGPGRALLSRG